MDSFVGEFVIPSDHSLTSITSALGPSKRTARCIERAPRAEDTQSFGLRSEPYISYLLCGLSYPVPRTGKMENKESAPNGFVPLVTVVGFHHAQYEQSLSGDEEEEAREHH